MKNTDIKNVYYQTNNAVALYWGDSLIWRKEAAVTGNNTLAGKFINYSTEDDWYIYVNGTKTMIPPECVNPDTKEFSYELPETLYDATNLCCAEYLVRVDKLPDTSNVTNMNSMFDRGIRNGIDGINLEGINTSKVTTMAEMFLACGLSDLVFPKTFDTSNVVNMQGMFYGAVEEQKTLDLSMFRTSKVTNMSYMFTNISVETLNLGNYWDMSNVTNYSDMFWLGEYYAKLINVTGWIEGIGKSCNDDFSLRFAPDLTNDSVMVFAYGLAETPSVSKNFIVNSKEYTYMSPEQIAMIGSKGWSVVSME